MVPLIFMAVLPTSFLAACFIYAAIRLADEVDEADPYLRDYQQSRRDDEV